MTPAPHVVVCPFIDPGGAGTVQDSYRILDLFRGIFARSSLEPIHGSARPCAPVHQSKTKASSAVVGEPRCAHTQVFPPPLSRSTKVDSLASPSASPPHEFAGAAPSRPLARSRLSEINFPKSPLGERLPGFSFEKNGFTRVKVARGPELYTKAWGGSTCVDRGRGAVP